MIIKNAYEHTRHMQDDYLRNISVPKLQINNET